MSEIFQLLLKCIGLYANHRRSETVMAFDSVGRCVISKPRFHIDEKLFLLLSIRNNSA